MAKNNKKTSKEDKKNKTKKASSQKSKSKKSKSDKSSKSAPKKKNSKTQKKSTSEKKQQSKKKKIQDKMSKSKLMNTPTIIALVVIILLGLTYIFRDAYLAAMVNGQPITRIRIQKEAEKMQGEQILEQAVLEALIVQKAREEGVQVSDEAVNEQINQIKENVAGQGQDFDQLLAMQGMTLAELEQQIKIQKLAEELVGTEVEVTQEDIDQYLQQNEQFLPEDATEEELQQQARQQLEQQKMSQKYQNWIEDLKENAQVKYFGLYQQETELTEDQNEIEIEQGEAPTNEDENQEAAE